jgi:hypothetical protein
LLVIVAVAAYGEIRSLSHRLSVVGKLVGGNSIPNGRKE